MFSIERALILFVFALGLTASGFATAEWVPEGFETLAQPQVTDIDIHYGGRRIASSPARFTATEVTLLEPETLAKRIPNALDPDELAVRLAAALPVNAGVTCRPSLGAECPLETREGVGLVFNRLMLKAELFIESPLLASMSVGGKRFLDASDGGLSLVNRITGNVSGSNAGGAGFSLGNRTLISWRENYLDIDSRLTTGGDLRTETFALRRDFAGRAMSLGRFRSTPANFSFLETSTLTGASLATSFNTRIDERLSRANPIEVFLPSRSRVEVFRNGELLDANFYDVGNQEIDTRRLPSGSYTVDLRITDSAGNVTTTTRFFSRSSRLPPVDEPVFFVDAGWLEDGSRAVTEARPFSLQAGYSWRALDSVAASVGLSSIGNAAIAEAGLFHQGHRYSLHAAAAADRDGGWGLDLRYRLKLASSSLDLALRHVDVDGVGAATTGLLGRASTRLTTSLHLGTPIGLVNVFHRYSALDEFSDRSAEYGLRWRMSNNRPRGRSHVAFELSRVRGETRAQIRFEWQAGDSTRHSATRFTLSDDGIGAGFRSKRRYFDAEKNVYDVEWRAAHEDFTSLESRFAAETWLGSGHWESRYRPESGRFEYSGRLSSTFALTRSGFSFGGRDQREAGFVVSLDGPAGDTEAYPILVDGIRRGSVRPGESRFVPVSAFRQYAVEVVAPRSVMTSVIGGQHQKTLYPGNVVGLDWQIRDAVILIGEVVDATGAPVADALVANADEFAMTDEAGRFQLEVARDADELVFLRAGEGCSARIAPPVEGVVGFAGTLRCRAEALTAAATSNVNSTGS